MSILKPMYSEFTGAFLRSLDYNVDRETGEPTPWLRPDWYDQLVTRASANMLRALDKAYAAGHTALAGIKDAVWFTVPAPLGGGEPALPVGLEATAKGRGGKIIPRAAGKWKINRWAVTDDAILDAHAKARPVPLREALTDAHNARVIAATEGGR